MHPIRRCNPSLLKKVLTDQVIIVTGANSGCGLETTRQLSKQGATVVLACVDAELGETAAKETNGVFLKSVDLASLESIHDFVGAFQEKYNRLDALVTNAGVMACPYGRTKEGFEMQFGVNHLGHFLLMNQLTPLLLKTADETNKPSRFVALSSCGAALTTFRDVMPTVDFEDLNWETREYHAGAAYGQSKLANYLHALAASQKYSSDKLISASVHPGWVYSPLDVHALGNMFGTGFIGRNVGWLVKQLLYWKGDIISPVDGAQTTLHCLLADDIQSGRFYSQMGVYKDEASKPGGWPMDLPNPTATPEAAEKLWEASEKLVRM